MENDENIALYQDLCKFLKKEKSEWKSLILGENEKNWAYSFSKEYGKIESKLLPSKYHPIFYAFRRKKVTEKVTEKVNVLANQEDEEAFEEID